MEWKYIGSVNASRLIEAMKCITEAIGAYTPAEQVELLESACEDLSVVIKTLRVATGCRICGDLVELGAARLCIKCQSQTPERRDTD